MPVAPSMTWSLVRMMPSGEMRTPEPMVCGMAALWPVRALIRREKNPCPPVVITSTTVGRTRCTRGASEGMICEARAVAVGWVGRRSAPMFWASSTRVLGSGGEVKSPAPPETSASPASVPPLPATAEGPDVVERDSCRDVIPELFAEAITQGPDVVERDSCRDRGTPRASARSEMAALSASAQAAHKSTAALDSSRHIARLPGRRAPPPDTTTPDLSTPQSQPATPSGVLRWGREALQRQRCAARGQMTTRTALLRGAPRRPGRERRKRK